MEPLSKEQNIVETLLYAFSPNDPFWAKLKDTAALLVRAPYITEEIIELLKDEGVIGKEVNFSDISAFLKKEGDKYTFLRSLKGTLGETRLPQELVRKLHIALLRYYSNGIHESKGDFKQFLFYFEEGITILQNDKSISLTGWLLQSLVDIVIHGYERPPLKKLLQWILPRLEAKEQRASAEGKLLLGATFRALGVIHMKDFEYARAQNALENAVRIFESIEPQLSKEMPKEAADKWKKDYEEVYRQSESQACYDLGEVNFNRLQFRDALANLKKAEKHVIFPNSIFEQIRLYFIIGAYFHVETNLLRLRELLRKFPEYERWYLFYLGWYLYAVGLTEDARVIKQKQLEIEEKKPDSKIWKIAAYRDLGVLEMKESLRQKKTVKKAVASSMQLLQTSIALSEQLDEKRLCIPSYIWQSRGFLLSGDKESCLKSLTACTQLLGENAPTRNKDYYDLQLSYAEYLRASGEQEEYVQLLQNLYDWAIEDFGIQFPFLKELIPLLKEHVAPAKQKSLNKHYALIESLPHPRMRVHDLKEVKVEDTTAMLALLHDKGLMILPENTEAITLQAYKLPFFKSFQLLHVEVATREHPLSRYFLFNRSDALYALDGSNEAIYKAAEKDFYVASPDDVAHYIKFFTDVLEGPYGKFHIAESIDDGISWSYTISAKQKQKQEAYLAQYLAPVKFLFKEDRWVENAQVPFWYFSASILFKRDLFICRFEVNEKTGEVRMHDENHITKGMDGDDALALAMDILAVAIN